MANYYGQARTNYFAVKDSAAFETEFADYPVNIITKQVGDQTLYGFLDADDNGGGLSWQKYDDDTDDFVDLDYLERIAAHLVEGSVAVLLETGAEKYRHLNGYAWAVNSKGETKQISLDHIYALAAELGDSVTRAEY